METTIEQKLKALFDLQSIHSKIDQIRTIRGELPMEVSDLEDDIAGLETRISKLKDDLTELEESINGRKNLMKDAAVLIKKYEAQQMNVKNNREFDALSKEMEIQGLEIQVSEKKIKEFTSDISSRKDSLTQTEEILSERRKDLAVKHSELETITAETQKEEDHLNEKAKIAEKDIEDRLMTAYNKLRNNSKNGLAVVTIQRDSCSGCFNKIPPQRQSDIRQRKKIIVCEHCGRILIDEGFLPENKLAEVL